MSVARTIRQSLDRRITSSSLKAHQISGAAGDIATLLGPDTAVVTASNGLPYWYFHDAPAPLTDRILETVDPGGEQWRRIGPERAIGCVVFPATEVVAPGVIRHEHGYKFPLGEPSGRTTARVERLSALFAAGGLEAPIRDEIRDEIWLKLWGNLCLNPISALTHATVDVVATDPGTAAVCRAMMTEAAAIAECIGVRLRVDMARRLDETAALGAHKMSMLQDLERGRSMEIEPMVGAVQELGRLTGVPTPTVDIVLRSSASARRRPAAISETHSGTETMTTETDTTATVASPFQLTRIASAVSFRDQAYAALTGDQGCRYLRQPGRDPPRRAPALEALGVSRTPIREAMTRLEQRACCAPCRGAGSSSSARPSARSSR
jgi:2-dehydropantoate 2-reductase